MSLRLRILISVACGIVLLLGLLSYFGISASRDSTRQTLLERLVLAEQVAYKVDSDIEQTFRQLGTVSNSDFDKIKQGDLAVSTDFLRNTRQILPFGIHYLCLIDEKGVVVCSEPELPAIIGSNIASQPYVSTVLQQGKQSVSNVSFDQFSGSYVVYLATPLIAPSGKSSMSVVAALDLACTQIQSITNVNGVGNTGYVEVVDGGGLVLATGNLPNLLRESDHGGVFAELIQNRRTAVSTCHSCHNETENPSQDIITFAPLSSAPWGVVVRQPEAEALENTWLLQRRLYIFGLVALAFMLPAVWFATRSITVPINRLTMASRRIAQGSLDEPVAIKGKDEISVLAQSFDIMRTKLKDSTEKTQKLYEEVRDKEKILSELLKNSISAQEEERKRIARELHDETSQALTTLAIGLETIAKSPPGEREQLQADLKRIQELAIRTLDEVHRLILDLRPSMLDDLGLVPAVEWYAKNRLEPGGVNVHIEASGMEKRPPPHIEVALFRIAQEAISNIAQHARAEYASISLEFDSDSINLAVEDDGVGFDRSKILSSRNGLHGLGLLGMKERVEVLGGKFLIQSEPGMGTQLAIKIPVSWNGAGNG